MKPQDNILKQLVLKKKQLLTTLLTLSQRDVININETNWDRILAQRKHSLNLLQENDRFIKIREIELNIQAQRQETNLYSEIGSIIKVIYENNDQTLQQLNLNKKILKTDRIAVRKETKISGYLHQMKSRKITHRSRA